MNTQLNADIDSRIFYESLLRKNIIHKLLNVNFYKKLIKFKNDNINYNILYEQYNVINNNNNIIFESHPDSKLNKKIINLIYKTNNFEQIQLSDIFNCISKKLKIKYNLTLTNNLPIYIFKFDFQNPIDILFIFKTFKIPYKSNKLPVNEQYIVEQQVFKNYVGDSTGLYFNGGNALLLFFNINDNNQFNQSTINHEIYHLLQDIFNIKIDLTDIGLSIDDNIYKYLQLTEQDIKYLYQPNEFETHIKIDLVDQLEEIYWKFYKTNSKKLFIKKFILQCYNSPLDIYNNEIINKIIFNKVKHKDLTSIRLFLSTFLLSNKKWNDLACKWLNETFN